MMKRIENPDIFQSLYQVYPQCLTKKFKFSERFFQPLISRERSSVKVWYFDRRVHALISLRIHHLNPWFSDAFMGRGIKCGDNPYGILKDPISIVTNKKLKSEIFLYHYCS